ncbi:MAG TPA: hypothetical protein VNP04_08080 [Alphaproteobacteria bacterium]|nr:hypothetical protein [Alphaproteobacteria bacterium]
MRWTLAVDVERRIILAQTAHQGPYHDWVTWRPLVDAAHPQVPIGLIVADAGFDSEHNPQQIWTVLQADSVIPAKRGRADWRIQEVRA